MKIFTNIGLLFSVVLIFANCSETLKNDEKIIYTQAEIKAESEKANSFFDSVFDARSKRSPIFLTSMGSKKDLGKWDDISEASWKEELQISKNELQYLKDSINAEALDKQTWISYELFKDSRESFIEEFKWRHHNFPIDHRSGLHAIVPAILINIHHISETSDAEAYISRLEGVKPLFDQLIKNLKLREEKNIVPPKFVFDNAIETCENTIKGAPFDEGAPSVLQTDFIKKVKALDLSGEQENVLIERANEALLSSVRPAYSNLIDFLLGQKERADHHHALWKWENGQEFYRLPSTSSASRVSKAF